VTGRVAVKDGCRLRCGTVDPHRNYPDDPDARWYQAEHGYQDPDWERRSADEARVRSAPDPRYPEEAPYAPPAHADPDRYGMAEPRGVPHGYDGEARVPRYADLSVSEPLAAMPSRTGPIGPRSGEPLPPLPTDVPSEVPAEVPAGGEMPRFDTESIDRTAIRRPGGLQGLGDGIYRSRRPAMAAVLALLTVAFEVPAVRVLLASFRHIAVSGTVASTLLVIALPMFAIGLYALAGGAAIVPGQAVRAWLRTPLAYLPMGLVLLVAAALAAA
jgi:hypothetical protein